MSSILNLQNFFHPRRLAVIGASADVRRLSGRPLRYLQKHGFSGQVYAVNPKYQEILGYPCYPAIQQVPGPVDLALVCLPAGAALQALEECAAAGVRFAIVFASGFAETGEEGQALQARLGELARRSGMRICGPNCIGVASLPAHLTAGFNLAFELDGLRSGPIAFVTQSGALGFGVFTMAQDEGIGFNYVVSTGNEADLTAADYLQFLVEDEDTRVIALYLESIRKPEVFLQAAEAARRARKPIVALKVGRSATGKRAAASHTGSLAGSDRIYDALFRQANVLRVQDVDELLLTASVLANNPLPQGDRVAILTSSGGSGIVMADHCEEQGLRVPELPPEVQAGLRELIPAYGSPLNPVDVTADIISQPELLGRCLGLLAESDAVDMVSIFLTTSSGSQGEELARTIVEYRRRTGKPMLVCWTAGRRLNASALAILREGGVPYCSAPGESARALARLWEYARGLETTAPAGPARGEKHEQRRREARRLLATLGARPTEVEAKRLLALYGVPVPPGGMVGNAQEAVRLADELGYPVVLKVQSPDISHKSDAHVVKLNLQNAAQVEEAYREVLENAARYAPGARVDGVLVELMVAGGEEVLVGISSDPQFGPCLAFGLGGIFVEVLRDVAFRLAPLSHEEALRMVREIRGYPLLQGVRGRPAADMEALADTLVRISQLAADLYPDLQEMDINPLLVLPQGKGVLALDALLVKGRGGEVCPESPARVG